MSRLFAALRAEIVKNRNSPAVWLSLAGTLANVALFFGLHLLRAGGFEAHNWETYIVNHYAGVAFMMLPLYVIILCSLSFLMESRHSMWQQLLTMPVPPGEVYLGKIAFLLLLFLGAHLLFVLGFLLSGLLLGLLDPGSGLLATAPPLLLILQLAVRTFLSILGLMSLHAFLSLRFQQFIVPLLIGILGYVFTGLVGTAWPGQPFNPYGPPALLMPVFNGAVTCPAFAGLTLAEWMSLGYSLLFTGWGMLFLSKRQWSVNT